VGRRSEVIADPPVGQPAEVVPKPLVLASSSPRRRELLRQLGLSFSVVSPALDEALESGESPRVYVERLARSKAAAVSAPAGSVVLAADTTVVLDGTIVGKPADELDASAMLRRLAGRSHHVVTAVAVAGAGDLEVAVVTTGVTMTDMSRREIDWYVGTGEPLDKAGAYGIQGIGGAFVAAIDGSYSNVVGLPLAETLALLRMAGVDPTSVSLPEARQ